MALDFIAGCIGGIAGVLVGHPLDTVKVTLQTQDYKNPVYKGTWDCFSGILRKESVGGLYKGVNSPLAGIAFVNAIVFGVYGNTMKLLHEESSISHSADHAGKVRKYLKNVGIAGSAAGLAQVVVVCPLELAKTRLQLDKNKHYSSISECLRKMYKEGGIRGIFKGLNITIVREIPSFCVYFVMYEAIMLQGQGRTVDMMVAGGVAGVSSWLSVYPIDVIKTRIQMDGMEKQPKYRNSWHCFTSGLAEEGYRFLFRGVTSTIYRAFPVNAVTFSVVTWILKTKAYFSSYQNKSTDEIETKKTTEKKIK